MRENIGLSFPGDFLTTREAALLIWLGVALAYVLYAKTFRDVLFGFAKHLAKARALHRFFSVLFLYMASAIALLAVAGLWTPAQIKSTLLWLALAAPAAVFPIVQLSETPRLWKQWISDNLKILVVVEFVAGTYTLPLLAELVLIPVATLLTLLIAVGERNVKLKVAVDFLNVVMMLLGGAILAYVGFRLAADWRAVVNVASLREFAVAPLLSLCLLPFLYGTYLYSAYERTFSPLKLRIEDKALRQYALTQAILLFGVRTDLLKRWKRKMWQEKPQTKEYIRRSMRGVFARIAREKAPPHIPPEEGWCPFAASKFLNEAGVATEDYHELYGEWFAQSQPFKLGDGLFEDYVIYCVNGDENAASELRLGLRANNPENREAIDAAYLSLCDFLLAAAAPGLASEIDLEAIVSGEDVTIDGPDARLVYTRERWTNGALAGEELEFRLQRGAAKSREIRGVAKPS